MALREYIGNITLFTEDGSPVEVTQIPGGYVLQVDTGLNATLSKIETLLEEQVNLLRKLNGLRSQR